MSDAESAITELKTQYAAQVAADLERNAKEQERIGAELAALQEQLQALQHDHTLLVNLQQTLGNESTAATAPGANATAATVPSLPQQASVEPISGRRRKAAGKKSKRTADRSSGTKASTAAVKQPTLVELIRNHLAQQSEPRSAAEITSALADIHPERDIKPQVVRTTVEGLVARSQVHRMKQGRSVFYTASETSGGGDSVERQDPVTA